MITMEEVERRLVALESAQTTHAATMKWMVGTLGQIQAVVDDHSDVLADHSKILAEHSKILAEHTKLLGGLRADVRGLASSMPEIVATAMRDVLAASKAGL